MGKRKIKGFKTALSGADLQGKRALLCP